MRRLSMVAALIAAVAALGGCSTGSDKHAAPEQAPPTSVSTPTPTGAAHPAAVLVPVKLDFGSVSRPRDWQQSTKPLVKDQVAAFVITDAGGRTVGQMDVVVNKVPAGSAADAINGLFQAQRTTRLKDLRTPEQSFEEVPGAASAFRTASTYTTDRGEPARSLEQLAISKDGRLMLVRISSAADAYDEPLFAAVLDTMSLTGGNRA